MFNSWWLLRPVNYSVEDSRLNGTSLLSSVTAKNACMAWEKKETVYGEWEKPI